MDSLKRFYLSLTTGLAILIRGKAALEKVSNETVANRVSREVLHYKTHFFNL